MKKTTDYLSGSQDYATIEGDMESGRIGEGALQEKRRR